MNLFVFYGHLYFLVSWLVDRHVSQGHKNSVSIYERYLFSNFSHIFRQLLCDGVLKFNFAFFPPVVPALFVENKLLFLTFQL